MSPQNEIIQQILSIKEHAHPSHFEGYLNNSLEIDLSNIVRTGREHSLLNQSFIEFLQLDMPSSSQPLCEDFDSAGQWPPTLMALLPSNILIPTLELWSACVYSTFLNKYIAQQDIQYLKSFFSQHYSWLICSALTEPNHPKNILDSTISALGSSIEQSVVSAKHFCTEQIPFMAFTGADMLSKSWPSTLRKLFLLKLIRPKEVSPPPLPLRVKHSQLETSIALCLKRISPQWYGKFFNN